MPEFDVKIVNSDGSPVMALNQVPIIPACAMHDIKDADVIILPSQGFLFNARDKDHSDRIEWLKTWYEKGSDLASVCAGAFTLASTGLLNGKTATTHWGMAKQFAKDFPEVDLRTDLLVTDEGRLFCGGRGHYRRSEFIAVSYREILWAGNRAAKRAMHFGRPRSYQPVAVCDVQS